MRNCRITGRPMPAVRRGPRINSFGIRPTRPRHSCRGSGCSALADFERSPRRARRAARDAGLRPPNRRMTWPAFLCSPATTVAATSGNRDARTIVGVEPPARLVGTRMVDGRDGRARRPRPASASPAASSPRLAACSACKQSQPARQRAAGGAAPDRDPRLAPWLERAEVGASQPSSRPVSRSTSTS